MRDNGEVTITTPFAEVYFWQESSKNYNIIYTKIWCRDRKTSTDNISHDAETTLWSQHRYFTTNI